MKKSFTLTELLVVMSIISLLMALSLPVARRVREMGWETVCQSNLRQMGMILKTYTNTNDNTFPQPHFIYHFPLSFYPPYGEWASYHRCCRRHDARIGLDSELLRHALLRRFAAEASALTWTSRCGNGMLMPCSSTATFSFSVRSK